MTNLLSSLVVSKKGSKRKPKISRGPMQSKRSRSAFAAAILNPFDPASDGCRVPAYGQTSGTITSRIKGEIIIGGVGNAVSTGGLVFYPNLLYSFLDVNRCNGGNSAFTTSAVQFGANPSCYGVCNAANLSAIYSSARIVSWGIRIQQQQPQSTCTGRFVIVKIPCINEDFSIGALTNVAMGNNSTAFIQPTGFPNTLLFNSSTIMNVPDSEVFACADLYQEDLIVPGKPVNPIVYDYRSTLNQNSYTATTSIGQDYLVTSATGAGVAGTYGWNDTLSCQGGEAICFYWEGVPISTTIPSFLIEYVYHLEGTPVVSAGLNSNPVVTATPAAHRNWTGFYNDLTYIAEQPNMFRTAVRAAAAVWQYARGVPRAGVLSITR